MIMGHGHHHDEEREREEREERRDERRYEEYRHDLEEHRHEHKEHHHEREEHRHEQGSSYGGPPPYGAPPTWTNQPHYGLPVFSGPAAGGYGGPPEMYATHLQQSGLDAERARMAAELKAKAEEAEARRLELLEKAKKTEHQAERNEIMTGVAALATAGFAAWEAHEAMVDPKNARAHEIAVAASGALAIGAGAYAANQHLAQKRQENVEESLGDTEKKHGWF